MSEDTQTQDTEAVSQEAEVDGPWPVIREGDEAGFAGMILGAGDNVVLRAEHIERLKQRQVEAGVAEKDAHDHFNARTWALLLPEVRQGAMGMPRIMLAQLLGMDANHPFDQEMADRIKELVPDFDGQLVTRQVWIDLVDAEPWNIVEAELVDEPAPRDPEPEPEPSKS